MKHLKTQQELNEASKNLNISDVMKSLSNKELQMIEKGKNHWNMNILNKKSDGYVNSNTIKELINKVIENTWTQAKIFYEGNVENNIS